MSPQAALPTQFYSNEQYRALYQGSPVPIFVWRREADDFVFVDCNDAADDFMHEKVRSTIGVHASDLLRSTPELLTAMHRCFAEKHSIHQQTFRRLESTGELKHLHITFVFVPPNDILAHVLDLSDQTLAEVAWKEAEKKFRDIFENTTEGIFQTTPDGTYLTANPAMARMLGFDSPEELITVRKDIGRQQYVDEERREDFKRLLAERGVVRGFEYEAYRKDGSKIWISDNVRAVNDENGSVLYYEGTADDITERKAVQQALSDSEERYRELFENSRDAIYVHDLSGRYLSVNAAAEKLSGYSREEILGRHFSDFIAANDLYKVHKNLCRKLKEHGETVYEIEIRTKDGRSVPVEVSSRIICQDEVPGSIQGTARDITDRKRAQEALQQFSRRLISGQEAERQRIARELHDEIGQALTAVRLNLQAIPHLCEIPDCEPYLQENLNAIDEALRLIKDLSLDLRPAVLDDLGLVAAVHWYVTRYAKRSGLVSKVHCESINPASRLPRELETTAFRILQEALTNVARHSKAKSVTVELQRSNGNLVIGVSDDGVGFNWTSREYNRPAATLGIRGMQERASALNGSLKIKSAPGQGTIVQASLPIALRS